MFLGRLHVPAIFSTIRTIGIIGGEAITDGTMIGRFVVLKKELKNQFKYNISTTLLKIIDQSFRFNSLKSKNIDSWQI